MKADPKTESEIVEHTKTYLETYKNRDMEGFLGLFVTDPDLVVIGTGVDEKCYGINDVKSLVMRDWSQSSEMSMSFSNMSVSRAGSVAWMAADCLVVAGIDNEQQRFNMRHTAVLEKRGGAWLIVQLHVSLPPESQTTGQSFPDKD